MPERIPLLCDTGVLAEIARGDLPLTNLIQSYDADGQPLIVPVLALAGGCDDNRSEDVRDSLLGLTQLSQVMVAPLADAEQSIALIDTQSKTGLELWDAHVAAIALASICPILTLDANRWHAAELALDQPLYVREIADPDERG